MPILLRLLIVLLLLLPALAPAARGKHAREPDCAPLSRLRPDMAQFAAEVEERNGMKRGEAARVLACARIEQRILRAMERPAEARPWYEYRELFVTPGRIARGMDFVAHHGELLERAARDYGVPAEIIAAIIGVETRYGANTGGFRVLDALATLAFEYPRRADYFRTELENFLVLTREEGLDPLRLRGSYAGAMGMPQFMPRSFRHYAVDYDGDGRRDIWGSPADTVASVANYLRQHGWRDGGPVAVRASVTGEPPAALLDGGYKPRDPVGRLRSAGVVPEHALPDELPARLLALEGDAGTEYWVALDNFHVITAYNRSVHYAMAIYQLSLELRPEPGGRAR